MSGKKYSNENRGSAWRNEDRTEDWHAPYRGKANVDGTWYFIDVFGKRPDANERAPDITIKFKKMDKQPGEEPTQQKEPASDTADMEDPIPF